MSIYESSITNPKKQLEFYKDLSEQLLQERNNYKELYEKEKGKVETYENPEDLTLFYMWLDEKAKDKMKQLNDRIDKAFSNLTLMLMDNDVSKEKALITIKNILGGERNE